MADRAHRPAAALGCGASLAPLPLVFPSFVGAAALARRRSRPAACSTTLLELVGIDAPRRFRGLGAAWLVLTLFTYPYVYLPVAARLAALPPSLEESARLLGDSPRRVFRPRRAARRSRRRSLARHAARVPLLRSATSAPCSCSATTRSPASSTPPGWSIGRSRSPRPRRCSGWPSSVVVVERRARGDGAVSPAAAADRADRPMRARPLAVPALVAAVGRASRWRSSCRSRRSRSGRGAALDRDGEPLRRARHRARRPRRPGAQHGRARRRRRRSWPSAVVLPVACSSAATAVALVGAGQRDVVAGFAVPGLVIALSLVFWTLNVPGFDRFYQTFPLLRAAYVVHFGVAGDARRRDRGRRRCPPASRESGPRCSARVRCAGLRTVDLPLCARASLAGGGPRAAVHDEGAAGHAPARADRHRDAGHAGVELATRTASSPRPGWPRSCSSRSPACSRGCSCCGAPTTSRDRPTPVTRPARARRRCVVALVHAARHPGARHLRRAHVTADEPQYLLTALSLGEDLDLDISDELARAALPAVPRGRPRSSRPSRAPTAAS